MFKDIPGNHYYKISLNGLIVNKNNEGCDLPIFENKVNICLYGKYYLLDLTWLALYSHYEIVLPEKLFNKVFSISFLETTPLARIVCNKWMVFKSPLLVNKKYRIIPRFTNYAISFDGEVIEVATGNIVPIVKAHDASSYHSVQVYDPDRSKSRSVMLHRLIALAWVYNPEPERLCIINHKDGNKTNNHPYNLEWETYTGNATHAFINNLRTDNVPCKIRNAFTKEVMNFESISTACKYMGFKNPDINSVSYKRKGKLICGKYEFKFNDDLSPWFYEDKEKIINPGRYVVNVVYENGEVESFYDLRDVKKKLKVWNVSSVNEIISKAKKLHPSIQITYVDNYDSRNIQGYEISTSTIIETDSISKMALRTNLNKNKIRTSIIAGETRNTDGWAFRYKTTTPWDTNFTINPGRSVRIQATNTKTNEVLIFNSKRSLAKHFTIDRCVITLCFEKNRLYKDWEFKELND